MTKIIVCLLLIYGACAGAVMLVKAKKSSGSWKELFKGSFKTYALSELVVFFLCAWGFPDFVMNTLLIKRNNWVKMEKLPAMLIALAVVPGIVIAASYLNGVQDLDLKTVLLCVAAISIGCFLGSRAAGKVNGERIRKIMTAALIVSMAALIIRTLFLKETAGLNGLHGIRLYIAIPFVVLFGFVNMFGVPMKPSATVLLLLLGMSPIHTLTLMLILGCVSPIIGSIHVISQHQYNDQLAIGGVIFGTIGAFLGTELTVQIRPDILNTLLILIMCFTVYTLVFQKDRKSEQH